MIDTKSETFLRRKRLADVSATSIVILLIILAHILGVQLEGWSNYYSISGDKYFENNWVIVIDNKETELSFPMRLGGELKEVVISNVLPIVMDNTDLVLLDQKQWVRVEVDGTKVYETQPPVLGEMKSTVGTSIISIPMYNSYSGKEIKIYLTQFDNGRNMNIEHVMLTTRYGLIATVLRKNIFNLMLVLFMVVGTAAAIVAQVVIRKKFKTEKSLLRFFAKIGLLFAVCIMWMLTDKGIFGLVTGKPVACAVMIYFFFTLLPIAGINVLMCFMNREHLYMLIFKYLFVFELVVQAVLFYYGIADLPDMLKVTHILIILFMMILVFHMINYVRKESQKARKIVLWVAGLLAAVIILSIIAYTLGIGLDYMTVICLGIVIFEIGLFTSAIKQLKEKLDNLKILTENEKISKLDVLTGLGNRRGFESYVQEISDTIAEGTDALIVMMELRGLVQINETAGRKSGDGYICEAASCINETFNKYGKSFRISGDTFAVVCAPWNSNYMSLQRELHRRLKESEMTYGEEIVLVGGISHLLDDQNVKRTVESWIREAEISMYIDKADHGDSERGDRGTNLKHAIDSIITHSENKQYGMQGHSDTVRELAIFIASRINLPPDQVESLAIAAKYHDVGVIGVSDTILCRKDKLTDAEFELIKKHTEIGDAVFAYTPGMQKVAGIIRHHHERFDGKGYPDGLKGEMIPLPARIITIADSIDAMMSPRSYRKAKSYEECKKELEKNSGSMYDSKIIAAVLNNWNGIVEIMLNKEKKKRVCEMTGEE